MSARDTAIVLLTALLDGFEARREWRHTDIAEIVDALIDAARAPESAHTRALAEDGKPRLALADETGRRSGSGRLQGRPLDDDGALAFDPERPA